MGYYTYFSLSADPFDGKTPLSDTRYEEIAAEIERMNIFEDHFSKSEWSVYTKWYDWEDDMLLLSSKFPEVLFTLNGDGEDSEDLWIAYFRAGYVQHCPAQFVYPEHDKSLLDKPPTKPEGEHYSYEAVS